MDIATIFNLIQKGLTVIGIALEAGESAKPAIDALAKLVSSAQADTVTEAQLLETEELLDKLIAEFNEPLPEE